MPRAAEDNYSGTKPRFEIPTPSWDVLSPVDPTGGAHTADCLLVTKAVAMARDLGVTPDELGVLLSMSKAAHNTDFATLTKRQRYVCTEVLAGRVGVLVKLARDNRLYKGRRWRKP